MMSLSVLCQKDIVSVVTGRNIGRRDDIEFSETTAAIENIVVFGRPKFFGLLGREKDIRIKWADVITVGQDVILISTAENTISGKNGRIKVEYD